ncbi:MAG: BspA family leucine-rich repeat surface protein [Lachnospiraceae bacterium]|nr:BspA family leucine-rich repeat surface protein [Lachnospiraceae bacterium]
MEENKGRYVLGYTNARANYLTFDDKTNIKNNFTAEGESKDFVAYYNSPDTEEPKKVVPEAADVYLPTGITFNALFDDGSSATNLSGKKDDIVELRWTNTLPKTNTNGFQFNPTITAGTSAYGNIVINASNTYDDKAILGWVDSSNVLNMYCKYKVGVQNGNLYRMFYGFNAIKYIDFNNFTSFPAQWTNLSSVFYDCNNLLEVDLSNIEWKVCPTTTQTMFAYCMNIKSINLTSLRLSYIDASGAKHNTANISSMFQECRRLEELDLRNFDISGIQSLDSLFYGCYSMKKLDISTFDTSNVTSMWMTFRNFGNSMEKLDLSHFDVSKVTNMSSMFSNASIKNLDLSNWDLKNRTDRSIVASRMFDQYTGERIYVDREFESDISDSEMFIQAKGLIGGNGTVFSETNISSDYFRAFEEDEEGIGYCTYIGKAERKPNPVRDPIVREVVYTEENKDKYCWSLINNRYKTTTVKFLAEANIDENYDASSAISDKERNIRYNPKNMILEIDNVDVDMATRSVGIYVDEAETVVMNEWSSKGFKKALSSYFSADASGSGDTFEGYQIYRRDDTYVLGKECVEVEFDLDAGGKFENPKSQFIYRRSERSLIGLVEGIGDGSYDADGLKFVGFIGKDANAGIDVLDGGMYINDYKLLTATNNFTYRINAREAVGGKVTLYGVYAYADKNSEPYQYRLCGTPITEDCKHEGMIGNHAAITDLSDDYLSTWAIKVDRFEKLLVVLPEKLSALGAVDDTPDIGYCYPRYWLTDDITIPEGFDGIFSEGMNVFLNGHTINYLSTASAIFDLSNGRKHETRIGKPIYTIFDQVKVNVDSVVDKKKKNETYAALSMSTNINAYLKSLLDEPKTYSAEDNTIERIIWADEKPQNFYGGKGAREAYDISESGGFTKYTDFSNVPDTAILAYLLFEEGAVVQNEVYLWTAADKVKWPETTLAYMFYNFKALQYVDTTKMAKTNDITNIRSMFQNCEALKNIDLSSIDVSKVTNTRDAFKGCANLERIYVEEEFSAVTQFEDVFAGCNKLVGGQGTKKGSKYAGNELLKIDTVKNNGWNESKDNRIKGVLTNKNQIVGHRYLNIVGATNLASSKGTIIQNGTDYKPGLVDVYGSNALYLSNLSIEGFGGDGVDQDVMFKDSHASTSIAENNLYINNVTFGNSFTSNHEMFTVKNLYIDGLEMNDVNLRSDSSTYLTAFKLPTTQNPVAYFKNVKIGKTSVGNNMNSLIDTEFTEGVNRRTVILKDFEISDVNSVNTMISLDKFTFKRSNALGSGEYAYFAGNNTVTNCAVSNGDLINVVPRLTILDEDGKTTINKNVITISDDLDNPRSMLSLESGLVLSGLLNIESNTFSTTMTVSTYSAALNYKNTNKYNKILIRDGGLNVKNNIYDPAGNFMRVRQFNYTYDFSKNSAGRSIPDDEHDNLCRNNPMLFVDGGYKFKASDSDIYIYANDLSGKYFESCVMATWSKITVEGYNEVAAAQIVSTFHEDKDHVYDVDAIYARDIYKTQKGLTEKVMFGINYVEITALLLERLPGDAEETKYNTRIATVSYQLIEKNVLTQVERPLNKDYYTWNDGTRFVKDLSEGVFWSGPNRNYIIPGTQGYGSYEVYDDRFSNAMPSLDYRAGDENIYERQVDARRVVIGAYIYGYETDTHIHTAGSEYGLTTDKEYWLEARSENHLNINTANIYLKKDVEITRSLVYGLEGEYSICLNGHNLIFNDVEDWVAFENSNARFMITNCKDDHTRSHGYITSKTGVTINHKVINMNNHAGRLVMASVSFFDINTTDSFVSINSYGTSDKFKSENIYIENVTMNNDSNTGFISFNQTVENTFANMTTGEIFNATMRKAANGDGNVMVSGKTVSGNVTVEKVKWSKTAPTSGTVYDVSQSGAGAVVTDLSSITDEQILLWWDLSYKTIYFYSASSYIRLNAASNGMFKNMLALERVDLTRFDTSRVTSFESMFEDCISLDFIDISRFNTTNVENISSMFSYCLSMKDLDLTSFDTSKVTNMSKAFANCSGLESVNLTSFAVKDVTNLNLLFDGCENLKTIYVGSNFAYKDDTSDKMFENCVSLVGGSGHKLYDYESNPNFNEMLTRKYARIDDSTTFGWFTAGDVNDEEPKTFYFDRNSKHSLYNDEVNVIGLYAKDNTIQNKANLISFRDIVAPNIVDSTFDGNSNIIYVDNATLSFVRTYITRTSGAYIYEFTDENRSVIRFVDSVISDNALTESYTYANKKYPLNIILGGVVEYKNNTRNGVVENLLAINNKIRITAGVDGEPLSKNSEVWFTATAPETEVFYGWNDKNVEYVNRGTEFNNVFHYNFDTLTEQSVDTLPATGDPSVLYNLTKDILGVGVIKYYAYNDAIRADGVNYSSMNVRYYEDETTSRTLSWVEFRNRFDELVADNIFKETTTKLDELVYLNYEGRVEPWWVGDAPAPQAFYSKGYYKYENSSYKQVGGQQKFYREDDKWYVGYDYVNVSYFVDKDAVKYKGKSIDIKDTYIKRTSRGSLVDVPYTLATIGEFDNKMSYLGFLGRNISITDHTSFIPDWDFTTNKVKGITYANFLGWYIDPMQNSNFDRVLYSVFTDDKVKVEGRGKASRSVISKKESVVEKYIRIVDNKVDVATKTVTSGVYEYVDHNGIVARDNYVHVATIPQLYYQYKSTGSMPRLYNTQYILGKDIRIRETKFDIDVMGKLYGERLIYMDGHNIYVDDENHNLFDTSNKVTLHPIYKDNALSFIGGKGASIIYASLSDATEFISHETSDRPVEKVLLSDVTIKGGRHIRSLVHTSTKLVFRNATISDMRYIAGNIIDAEAGSKLEIAGLAIKNNDLVGQSIINVVDGADFFIATNSNLTIANNRMAMDAISLNGNREFSLFGNFYVRNNVFTGDSRYKIANITGKGVFALGNIELAVKNNKHVSDETLDTYGFYYSSLYSTALFRQLPGTKFKASESVVNIYHSQNNCLVYSGWYEGKVEGYDNGYISANKTFLKDIELPRSTHIYKKGTASNCNVYIGDDCVPVEYVYLDDEEGKEDVIIATQYVARNAETKVESIINPTSKEAVWFGPALDDDKALVYYGDNTKNITVIITSINPGRIYGEEEIPHSHMIATDYDVRIATYFNARNVAMFRRGFRQLYLRKNLHITEDVARTWSQYEEIDICLNGKTLTIDKNISFLDMSEKVKVVITDCKGTGHFELLGGQDATDKYAIEVNDSTLVLNHINFININRTLVKGTDESNVIINYSTISNTRATSSIFVMDGDDSSFDIENTKIATNYNATPIITLAKAKVATFNNIEAYDNQAKASALIKVEKVADMKVLGGEYHDNTNINNTSNPYANEGVIFNIDDEEAKVTIKDGATFYGNKSTYREAGAIYVNRGTLNVDGEDSTITFDENISSKGASIYGSEDSIINIRFASFSNSKAENYEGAAIYSKGKASISDTTFTGFRKKGSIVHFV